MGRPACDFKFPLREFTFLGNTVLKNLTFFARTHSLVRVALASCRKWLLYQCHEFRLGGNRQSSATFALF